MLQICTVTNTVGGWQRTKIYNLWSEDVVYTVHVRWHLLQRMIAVETVVLITTTHVWKELKQYGSAINNGSKDIFTHGPSYLKKW